MRANPDASARQQLEAVAEVLLDGRAADFNACVAWARGRFQDYFHNRIAQLTYTFPEDATTSTGAPFWSAPKRFPRPLNFDPKDPAHAAFVQVGAHGGAAVPMSMALGVRRCPAPLSVGPGVSSRVHTWLEPLECVSAFDTAQPRQPGTAISNCPTHLR